MRRLPVGPPRRNLDLLIPAHGDPPWSQARGDASVILLEINSEGIAILEFKSDAPRPVDLNRMPDRLPPQRMKIKAGNIHVLRTPRAIKGIEPTEAERAMNAGGSAGLEQLFEAFVPEAPDPIH
jgi:hypothetical protein